jgi:hypothetical protein
MKYLGWVVLIGVSVSVALGDVVTAHDLDFSGMARTGKNSYIIVNDKKNKRGELNDAPRVAILTVKKKGISHEVIKLEDPDHKATFPPNDLEAVCALPGRENEFFLAESGYRNGMYGRILYAEVWEGSHQWKAKILRTFHPFPLPQKEYSTPDADQIEGMGCVPLNGEEKEIMLILARRGGNLTPAVLVWGTVKGLDEEEISFSQEGEAALTEGPNPLGGRGSGDLFVQREGEGMWRIWTAATVDPGDEGPFRSLIYSPGSLVINEDKRLRYIPGALDIHWVLEGFKVEALAGPPKNIPNSVLSMGTDDENYGGVWRPLFAPKNAPGPIFPEK